MSKVLKIILVLFSINCFSQNTIKITYENKAIILAEQLKDLPKIVQEKAIKQIEESAIISTLNIKDLTSFYSSETKSLENKELGTIATKIIDGKKVNYNDLSTTIESSKIKFSKSASKNTYTEMINGKLISKYLQKTKWKKGTKIKKILGYNCKEAIGIFNKKKLTVYYTTELNAKASPDLLPFTDGVILEYNTGTRQGIAIKVELNEPNITDFFKTK